MCSKTPSISCCASTKRESPRGETATHLLLVLGLKALARQLSLLPDGDERRTQSQREDRAEEETSCVEADDGVDLGGGVVGLFAEGWEGDAGDVVQEVGDESLRNGIKREADVEKAGRTDRGQIRRTGDGRRSRA